MRWKHGKVRLLETSCWVCGVLGGAVLLSSPIAVSAAETNLIADTHFEFGIAGFTAQDASSSVSWSMQSPLEGAHSLRVSIAGYGNNIWSSFNAAGARATSFKVSAHLRSDVASSSSLQFCAMAYYTDNTTDLECKAVSGAVGDKGIVTTQLDLDPTKPLDVVHVRLMQEGSAPVTFTLDDAGAFLAVVPNDGGGGGGGDDGGGGTAENLILDPHFESTVSDFSAQDDTSSVTLSAQAPLQGAKSLRVSIAGWGNSIWWAHSFTGGRARSFRASAHLRSDVASASTLQFCATGSYKDGTDAVACTPVSGGLGDKGTVSARIVLDSEKPLESVRIRLYQEGSAPITFTLDDAIANLDVVQPATGGGESPSSCTVSPGTSAYPGFTYHLPANRPFISLAHYAHPNLSSTAYARFKAAADAALAGNPPYLYSAKHSVMMYAITANVAYLDDAIARVQSMVSEAEAVIAQGGRPAVSNDSYLDVGGYLEDLSLAYDYGYNRLTAQQRQSWEAFAEQTVHNVWNPSSASWGGVGHAWSGWSVCDPGNNYHYSFLRATMMWALASKSTTWLSFLQTQKFPPLIDYYKALPGGGTREGTGYGTALRNLLENYIFWKDSTGEDLAALIAHTRESIDYWVHATVPTRDRFAPIGDQSRVSVPDLYDYHENLVHEAVVLSQGTPQAKRGTWWLQNNSVNGVSSSFNLHGDLLPLPDPPITPTELTYRAEGAGVLFARSSWNTNASWLALVAGKYDQSHAHQDQGSFTFFKNDWLVVTANIWSRSGIHQDTPVHNGIRFERADGSVIAQSQDQDGESTMSYTSSGGALSVTANLSHAYWRDANSVQSWTRNLQYSGATLRVTDACTVANDVRPVFQINVPVRPVLQQDGSVTAGALRVVPLRGETATIVTMPAPEYSQGYRIDFRSSAGCSFDIQLNAP